MNIRGVEVELFYAHGRTDEQTDVMKLIVAICNFAKRT
jgi:hypothetical protein